MAEDRHQINDEGHLQEEMVRVAREQLAPLVDELLTELVVDDTPNSRDLIGRAFAKAMTEGARCAVVDLTAKLEQIGVSLAVDIQAGAALDSERA